MISAFLIFPVFYDYFSSLMRADGARVAVKKISIGELKDTYMTISREIMVEAFDPQLLSFCSILRRELKQDLLRSP